MLCLGLLSMNLSEGANCHKLPKADKKDGIRSYIHLIFLSFVINNKHIPH